MEAQDQSSQGLSLIYSALRPQQCENGSQLQDMVLQRHHQLSISVRSRRLSQVTLKARSAMLSKEESKLLAVDKQFTALALQSCFRNSEFGEGGRLLTRTAIQWCGVPSNVEHCSERIKAGSIADYFRRDMDSQSVERLLDASLRFIFCERRSNRSNGIYLSRMRGSPPLSIVAPVLFSPGLSQVRSPIPDASINTLIHSYLRTSLNEDAPQRPLPVLCQLSPIERILSS